MTARRRLSRAAVLTVAVAGLLVAGCAPRVPAADPPAAAAGDVVAAGGADTPPAAVGAAGGVWAPRPGLSWRIELSGTVAATGAAVYDLDPYATGEQTVQELHAAGAVVVCHLDVGVADGSLPDAARLSGSVLGRPASAGARWLDIRRWDLIAPVLTDRLQLCRGKGFDGVDADHADTYLRTTGLPLSRADQVSYDMRVAGLARAAGLAVGERTGAALAAGMLAYLDFAVVDGCFARGDCPSYFGYIDRGKAVFDVEAHPSARYCARARAYGFAVTTARPDLGGC